MFSQSSASSANDEILTDGLPLVVNCGLGMKPGSFYEPHTRGRLRWLHFAVPDKTRFRLPGPLGVLWRFACAARAARAAVANRATVVITHDPHVSVPVQYFLRLYGYRGSHLAFSFNYAGLPQGLQRKFHARGLAGISRFVTYSRMERELYEQAFGIPQDRMEFLHWGVNPPLVEPADQPVIAGEYICAIGGNSRDYATFVNAMRELPEMRAVIVARPENLQGILLPSNTAALFNIPLGQAMNVLAFSRFMVLPLQSRKTPCGHVTLVSAMFLGKAIASTDSVGIEDYLPKEENALSFPAGDVDGLVQVIKNLWSDRALCERLGAAGKVFAQDHCTETSMLGNFLRILNDLGVATNGTGHEV